MSTSLADALDWCIDAMLACRLTIEECRDAWPEHRAELGWLLPAVEEFRMLGSHPIPVELAVRETAPTSSIEG